MGAARAAAFQSECNLTRSGPGLFAAYDCLLRRRCRDAYFAQTAEVYRVLDRPATPILHRASLTMVEKHTWRTLDRYHIGLTDFFAGSDHVISRVVAEYLGKE